MMKAIQIIRKRWKARMPKFFKWVMGIGTSVAATALAIQMALNSAGANIPEWWATIYPYLIGIGAGMTAVAKLTREEANTKNNFGETIILKDEK